MSIHRLVLVLLCACASTSELPDRPDGTIVVVPIDPTGTYAVRSELVSSAPPADAAAILGTLSAATDGPDDPSRYLIDLVIAQLPEGTTRTIAQKLAPYLAAYVTTRLASVAPHFGDGVRALVAGLHRVSTRFGTLEELHLDDGHARRMITGVQLDGVDVMLASSVPADVWIALEDDRLTIGEHAVALPYGEMLRLGLDRAVIPRVVPGASNLAHALASLIDCPALGTVVAEWLGIGSASLYASACTVGLTVAAAEIYERLPMTASLPLTVTGVAQVEEGALVDGTWTGTFGGVPLASASFEATRQ